MIIKLTSTEDKSEQILEVIGLNHEDGSNEIKILNSLAIWANKSNNIGKHNRKDDFFGSYT